MPISPTGTPSSLPFIDVPPAEILQLPCKRVDPLERLQLTVTPYLQTSGALLFFLEKSWKLHRTNGSLENELLELSSRIHASLSGLIIRVQAIALPEVQSFYHKTVAPLFMHCSEKLALCGALTKKHAERAEAPSKSALDDLIYYGAVTGLNNHLQSERVPFLEVELQREADRLAEKVQILAQHIQQKWEESWDSTLCTLPPSKVIAFPNFHHIFRVAICNFPLQQCLSAHLEVNIDSFYQRSLIVESLQKQHLAADFPCSLQITTDRKVIYHFTSRKHANLLGEGGSKKVRVALIVRDKPLASVSFRCEPSQTSGLCLPDTSCPHITCTEYRNLLYLQTKEGSVAHIALPEPIQPLIYLSETAFSIRMLFPLYSGGDLFHALHARSFDLPTQVRIVTRIAEAVSYLHDHAGMVHWDLKSNNVLLDDQNRPFLTDFGCSTRICDIPPNRLATVTHTSQYAPPEFLEAFLHSSSDEYFADPTLMDRWALGCIFWEVLIGPLPWINFNSFEEVDQYHKSHEECLGYLPDLSTPIQPILSYSIYRLLQVEVPENRATAAEVAHSLRSSFAPFFA